MEAVLTPVVELVWSKQRILEVYLNVAEFGDGVFGIQAAAQHHFGVDAKDLTVVQAARLAAVLARPEGPQRLGADELCQEPDAQHHRGGRDHCGGRSFRLFRRLTGARD
jgi:membrane carboxypeptidase/penicillin-binding protein PbpC